VTIHRFQSSRRIVVAGSLVAMLLSPAFAQERRSTDLLVFAASSLTNVLEELSTEFARKSGVRVRLSFAASSVLARQIEAGTQADVFVSADQDWMNYLADRRLLDDATRRDLAGNRLVLIAPADSELSLDIEPGFALAAALGGGRLATGDPDTVPVGKYARAALTKLGVWSEVQARIARADNVRSALMYVARGEAPLGIVYATDAAAEPRVRVVGRFPADSHDPITYPAAATRGAGSSANAYLEFLGGPDAAATWRRFGFGEIPRKPLD
jgi:molybdate transport system substrate-binding protein